ncbi:MAG: GGDEF domain-containing protein [Rhizobiaceae bacterium]
MDRALKRSLGIVLISMIGSLAVTGTVLPVMGVEPSLTALVMCIAAPMLIAFPISYRSTRQNERLRVALAQLNEAHITLAYNARRDSLTGLLNRGAFIEELHAACGTPKNRHGVLLMIDADDFKGVNDRFGHAIGDKALQAIADAMSRALRINDVCGRIGGEEFAVILPATSLAEGYQIAERLRREVELIRLDAGRGESVGLSVSIGAALLRSGADASTVMRLADKRLYGAKDGGRNQTVFPRGAWTTAAA